MKYKSRPAPGTVADLVVRYLRSPRVLAWAPSTAVNFTKTLRRFMAANASRRVDEIRRGDIIAMRDEAAQFPGAANNWLKVITGLLDYAADIEMIPYNPARGIKRLPPKTKHGFRTWREDEIRAFEAHWPIGTLPRRAFTLALYTGAARSDLVALGWPNVQGDRVVYRRAKTAVEVSIPILPAFAEELALIPCTQMTFLETRTGTVRSDLSLYGDFRKWVVKAGLGGKVDGHYLSLHGLRKALGHRLADAGCTEGEVMAVLGHRDSDSVRIYTEGFNREQAADRALEKLGKVKPSNVTHIRRP